MKIPLPQAMREALLSLWMAVSARRLLLLCLYMLVPPGQEEAAMGQEAVADDRLQVMFWNVENFFDTEDDPERQDNDFLPSAERRWTPSRFSRKALSLARVIAAAAEKGLPDLIGIAEVENDSVMVRWTQHSPFARLGYRYVMTESPDVRGLDVALLYQPGRFRLLGDCSIRVAVPAGCRPTRDLLHVWGISLDGDTLDVLVCHLPSRLGGTKASAPARQAAHHTIRRWADSLAAVRREPRLLVMGDMNDTPHTSSLVRELQLQMPPEDGGTGDSAALYNLMLSLDRRLRRGGNVTGTYKYRGEWEILDQFWCNGILLPQISDVRIFSRSWMLTEDAGQLGTRPMRTYRGFSYEGGYSDHLPVVLDIHFSR